ncbi:uncharacterized protein (TIGR00255 family) [Breoghania corrubedonensis]|uniref:Uncharacterized protein (TIGR00255 family) n=1 Tax=Breoghania corrubedonensis TaxID=665038 RepID=A0A2T5V9N7_9HYPH|nr:YicC/YloC family endoribonuclease [Breoghania corrubedonensis]PTW60441.1 uncharacterized protein (TIGR00255 family) [Breoghania corrubedonensis]
MTLASMTGFARAEGTHGAIRWTWELRSVNGKGLDVRFRLGNGFDSLEPALRKNVGAALARGNVNITLSVHREAGEIVPRINDSALEAVIEALEAIRRRTGAAPATAEGILSFRGVFEVQESEIGEEERARQHAAVLASFETALADLVSMRQSEGDAVQRMIEGHVTRIASLTEDAENCPARSVDGIRARLAQQVRQLMEHGEFDEGRLHQEAVLLATKADIREELDRLKAHVAAVCDLIASGGPIGRKLDFLAQEFNREANTLCSKANDTSLTAIGLDLKTTIDQLREQIQNLE